jgi:anti-anti-sigma factor
MSFHFLSHPWDVRNVADGIFVTLTQRDLDRMTVSLMVDELYDLVLENGAANLYLEFEQVNYLASIVISKMIGLDARLRLVGGRLILSNLDPSLYETLQAACVADTLDIRVSQLQNA